MVCTMIAVSMSSLDVDINPVITLNTGPAASQITVGLANLVLADRPWPRDERWMGTEVDFSVRKSRFWMASQNFIQLWAAS